MSTKLRNAKCLHFSIPFFIFPGPLRKVRRGSGTTHSPLPMLPETQNRIKKHFSLNNVYVEGSCS